MSEQVDILIAGGGLVGLSLCAGLSESGFKTVVIDRQGPPVFEPGQSGRREGHGLSSGVSPGECGSGFSFPYRGLVPNSGIRHNTVRADQCF